ncbi:MAG: UDP-N-acetylglucosamine--N-acetylmuramyl-(pentapeptide) pyrophosphoryl-undecaprenol N-acetylglucosamine transferase [Anaerolineae bacterium]|nr:UDP-N-acetylglucosamine--N-acetylmuramyl-(pentapeptide) pyrophosphoryl-undecaprenol N-acetylglucosamine transferase [Anaerolineae bacterium]
MLWVGSRDGMEQGLVEQAGLTFTAIPAGGLRGKNPVALLTGAWKLGRGFLASRRIIREFQPDALFITGGYVGVPVTLAARLLGIPVLIYLPDIEPGLAIKFLARFADKVAVTMEDARQFFPAGLTVVTGYPVRAELTAGRQPPQKLAARKQLNFDPTLPLLLVFGGSRGARSINKAIAAEAEAYLNICQIMHITGPLDEAWVTDVRTELPPALRARYQVRSYLHDDMSTALIAADLVVSRAGASTLGEFPALGLPAILVPYPYAGAHQALNAAYLARYQAAVVIDDALLSQQLKDTVLSLLTDSIKLQAMSRASQALAQPQAALCLAQEILGVSRHGRN